MDGCVVPVDLGLLGAGPHQSQPAMIPTSAAIMTPRTGLVSRASPKLSSVKIARILRALLDDMAREIVEGDLEGVHTIERLLRETCKLVPAPARRRPRRATRKRKRRKV
jgi:hypothetical protein